MESGLRTGEASSAEMTSAVMNMRRRAPPFTALSLLPRSPKAASRQCRWPSKSDGKGDLNMCAGALSANGTESTM
jgi:hypothetical protein